MTSNSVIEKITRFKQAAAAEIVFFDDDQYSINLTVGLLKKDAVIKTQESIVLNSFDLLFQKIGPTIPLRVIINGKPVLTKTLTHIAPNIHPITVAFPEADQSKFYFSLFKNQFLTSISIIRKEVAEDIASKLLQQGLMVVDLGIGFGSASTALLFLNKTEESKLVTNWLELTLNSSKEITAFQQLIEPQNNWSGREEYLIGNQYVHPFNLISFGALIQLLSDHFHMKESLPVTRVRSAMDTLKWKRYFNAASIGLLTSILILLLINFAIYMNYRSKNEQLMLKQQQSLTSVSQTAASAKTLEQMTTAITSKGWIQSSRISLLADRIASLLPEEIVLTSLLIYVPKNESTNYSGEVSFQSNKIQVGGTSPDPSYVNAFLNNLTSLSEVKEVKIKNYTSKRNEIDDIFLLEITTK